MPKRSLQSMLMLNGQSWFVHGISIYVSDGVFSFIEKTPTTGSDIDFGITMIDLPAN